LNAKVLEALIFEGEGQKGRIMAAEIVFCDFVCASGSLWMGNRSGQLLSTLGIHFPLGDLSA
jgi:hypothetical protein